MFENVIKLGDLGRHEKRKNLKKEVEELKNKKGCGKLSWFSVVLKNILILHFGFVVLNFEKDFKKVLLFKIYFEYFLKRKIERFYFKIYDLVKKIFDPNFIFGRF